MAWPDNAEIDPLFDGWDASAFNAGSTLLGGWYSEFAGLLPDLIYTQGTRYARKDKRFSPLIWVYPQVILRR